MDPLTLGLIYGGGKLIEGFFDTKAAREGANAQLKGTREAIRATQDNFNKGLSYVAPYTNAGNVSLDRIMAGIADGSFDPGEFDYQPQENYNPQSYTEEQFDYQQDPGYQARLAEGQRAIESSAAARGHQLSGATLKALAQYGQDYASNEYNKAYTRFDNSRRFNRGNFESDRNFGRGTYESDRGFNYGLAGDRYNSKVDSANRRFRNLSNIANTGAGAAGSVMGSYNNLGARMGDYAQERGILNAGKNRAPYDAAARGIGDIGNMFLYRDMANAKRLNSIGGAQ